MLLPKTSSSDAARTKVLAEIERAIYLTRAGRHDDAREIYRYYRGESIFGDDVEASLMLMLLEGLIIYFADCDVGGAIDRLYRARALGMASKSDAGVAVICSWLAHLYFNSGSHEKMASCIHEAIDRDVFENEFAAERLLLTVADAHSLAGDFIGGRVYYDRARSLASTLGDSISIAAAAHNRSTLALSHARFAHAVGEEIDVSVSRFLLELKSAENLENYLKLENVLYPYTVWIARLAMLDGDFIHASDLIGKFLERSSDIPPSLRPALYADMGYCSLKCNDINAAIKHVRRSLDDQLDQLASDDLAVIFSFASQIYAAINDESSRDACVKQMMVHSDAFRRETHSLEILLPEIGRHIAQRSNVEK